MQAKELSKEIQLSRLFIPNVALVFTRSLYLTLSDAQNRQNMKKNASDD